MDRTRVSGARLGTPTRPQAPPASSSQTNEGAIDHWSIVLLYSMGIGTLAVTALMFLVLIAVWFYGQFVWTFTQWDLANVSLAPFKTLAYFLIAGTFIGGMCVGLWCFSGAAWKNRSNAPRRTSR